MPGRGIYDKRRTVTETLAAARGELDQHWQRNLIGINTNTSRNYIFTH